MMNIKEGDVAPDFSALNHKGEEIKLSKFKGQNVVLYFYPKDDTPGCTIEAKEFTEFVGRFANAQTRVLGVSYDDQACHAAFIEKHGLKIDLVSDTTHRIANAYHSEGNGYPSRNTFVIDEEGRIKKVFWKVNPKGHAAEVLKAVNG